MRKMLGYKCQSFLSSTRQCSAAERSLQSLLQLVRAMRQLHLAFLIRPRQVYVAGACMHCQHWSVQIFSNPREAPATACVKFPLKLTAPYGECRKLAKALQVIAGSRMVIIDHVSSWLEKFCSSKMGQVHESRQADRSDQACLSTAQAWSGESTYLEPSQMAAEVT